MNNKIKLTGLQVDDYIHPEETKVLNQKGNKSIISEGLNLLNDISVSMVRKITLGKYVELNEINAERIINILEDVCNILDFPSRPALYICHEANSMIIPAGTDKLHILMADYILREFDENMLYFIFGNAVAMYKGNHTKLNTVCSVMCGISLAKPYIMKLQSYLRAADLSSDRAGLLACQDFSSAAKCILWNMGMPISELNNMNSEQIAQLAKGYIKDANIAVESKSGNIAVMWGKLSRSCSLDVKRLEELYKWYFSGEYSNLISKWKQG